MFKTIVRTGLFFLVLSTSALADGVAYLGGDVGVVNNNGNRVIPLTVFGGYGGFVNQNYYLGGELVIVPVSAEITNTESEYTTTYGFGLSFVPGVSLNENSILLGRLGVIRTHFDTENSNVMGGQVGIGLQTSVSQNLDIRGEYIFTVYRSFSDLTAPKSDQVNIGIVFRVY